MAENKWRLRVVITLLIGVGSPHLWHGSWGPPCTNSSQIWKKKRIFAQTATSFLDLFEHAIRFQCFFGERTGSSFLNVAHVAYNHKDGPIEHVLYTFIHGTCPRHPNTCFFSLVTGVLLINKLGSWVIKLLPGLTTGPPSRFVGKATYLLSSLDVPGILIEKM